MKIGRAAALLAVLMAAPNLAAAAPSTFQGREDRLAEARAAYDRKTVDALFDEQLVFVFPNGRVAHKPERMAGLVPPKDAVGALTSHNDSVQVQFEDKSTAIVLVRSSWRQGDVVQGKPYVATHIWIHRPSGWRLVAAQVAQVAQVAPASP